MGALIVDRDCRLISVSHGIMGMELVDSSRFKDSFPYCILMSPNGRLQLLEVPFHIAMKGYGNLHKKDLQILKQVRSCLLKLPMADGKNICYFFLNFCSPIYHFYMQ